MNRCLSAIMFGILLCGVKLHLILIFLLLQISHCLGMPSTHPNVCIYASIFPPYQITISAGVGVTSVFEKSRNVQHSSDPE